MIRRKMTATLGLVVASSLALAACSPSADDDSTDSDSTTAADNTGDETGDDTSGDKVTVTFRLWDDVAAPAYEESFDRFMAENPDINVEVEVVPWADYWERLPLDLSSGDMADIFWVNTSNFGIYVDNGQLLSISEEIGNDHDEWQTSITDLYSRNGELWGVPQIWDSIALFYNKEMVDEAGIDPTTLKWVPGAGEGDTLVAAAQKLTKDSEGRTADDADFDASSIETFGFNSQNDLQAIYVNFLAENGAQFQGEDDQFAFASPEGVEAFQYLVDLIHEYNVAPPASETNTNGDYSRELFVRGELGLFQSGPYALKTIADTAEFEWALAPKVEGPEGRISVVHGVAAVGNAGTENKEETVRVLQWLGSADGQMPLAEQGISFPGAVEAQDAFVNYWAEQGVDVSVFIEAAQEPTAKSPVGPQVNAGSVAMGSILQDIFAGNVGVEEGLQEAQEVGNDAMQ